MVKYNKEVSGVEDLGGGLKAVFDLENGFSINNGAAIPPNLLAIPNTESNSSYMRYCQEKKLKTHPARFPADLPEYFIRMLTDPGDFVFDPFGGSCVTGEVAERLGRKWACAELVEDYLKGALGRFERPSTVERPLPTGADAYYRIPRPGLLWNGPDPVPLAADGGKTRPASMTKKKKDAKQKEKTSGLSAPDKLYEIAAVSAEE